MAVVHESDEILRRAVAGNGANRPGNVANGINSTCVTPSSTKCGSFPRADAYVPSAVNVPTWSS